MPLHDLKHVGVSKHIALWHIAESEAVLSAMAGEDSCPRDITYPRRRLEWQAGRVLAKLLVRRAGLLYRGVGKDAYGRPFLRSHPHHFSLSHSFPYVAAQLHISEPVGIDVEQPCEKLLRVVPRILSPLEAENAGKDIVKLCVYWCAKEALYKIYGKKGLPFAMRLKVAPFDLSQGGGLLGSLDEAHGFQASVRLCYRVHACFVLVYSRTI